MTDWSCSLLEVKTGILVPAYIHTSISPREFRNVAGSWDRSKQDFREAFAAAGTTLPENDLWNWEQKARTTTPDLHHFLGVFTDGPQGMMMLSSIPTPSRRRHQEGNNVLYIEYVETAPWNLPEYAGRNVLYRGIGSALLAAAVQLSVTADCNGRLALHSLQAARGFYEKAGFENLGLDPEENLEYFELAAVS